MIAGRWQKEQLTKDSKSPFETKAAKTDLPRYGGEKDKIGLWRRKITYYLHSKCTDMKALLGWAEKRTEPITTEEIDEDSCSTRG